MKNALNRAFPDAQVRFASDGPQGAILIRLEGTLYTGNEAHLYLLDQGFNPYEAYDYIQALNLEVL